MPPSPLSEVELGGDGECLKPRGCEQPRAEAIASKERSAREGRLEMRARATEVN
jgi:hypothetical protein